MADEKQIKIEVRGKIATLTDINFQMVGGNSDYKVVFDFDEDWDRHNTKTALFVFGNNKPVPKVFEGNICKGVAITNATSCYIGVFSGDIITSTPARIDCVFQSITDIGGTPEEPTPSVYNQIIELINKYISQGGGGTGGGGVSEEAVVEIIEKYFEENPIPKEVQNITSIDTIYNDVSELPTSNVSNGTRWVALTKGKLPLIIYTFDTTSRTWSVVDECRGSTAYIVLQGDKAGMYRYTMDSTKNYFVSVESHTLQEAKDYTDNAIKKYHEENPVRDGLTPYIKDGYWWIGETNTNVKAEGEKGDDYILTEADKTEIGDKVRADLEDIIGDIDTALDELHTYAQNLVNGGNAQ